MRVQQWAKVQCSVCKSGLNKVCACMGNCKLYYISTQYTTKGIILVSYLNSVLRTLVCTFMQDVFL